MRKTVLITGASRGIGRAAAQAFAQQGYCVAVNYCTHADAAASLVEELRRAGQDAIAIQADVSDRTQVEAMFEEINCRWGSVDVLVNNAGIAQFGLFTDVLPQQWEAMLAVNVHGMFHCCQCALPGMIRRKTGSIVNVSSMWGVTGASCEVGYSAAKAAVIGFTRALAKEVGPSGIRVNCVAPGVVDTDMNAALTPEEVAQLAQDTPLGRIGTPAEIAECILFLAEATFVTGQVLGANGGYVI